MIIIIDKQPIELTNEMWGPTFDKSIIAKPLEETVFILNMEATIDLRFKLDGYWYFFILGKLFLLR